AIAANAWDGRETSRSGMSGKRRDQRHFPKQTVRLPRLAQKNETMGTRGTHGTNYLLQGIKELQRGSRRLNVSRETFWRSFQEIIYLIRPSRLTGAVSMSYARPCPSSPASRQWNAASPLWREAVKERQKHAVGPAEADHVLGVTGLDVGL